MPDRAVGQSQLLAQILQAEPVGFHQNLHRALLRPGQAAALNQRFDGPVYDLPHRAQIAIEFPGHVRKLRFGHLP